MHITACKQLTPKDIQLLSSLTGVLNQIPFQPDLQPDKQLSLVSIVYHILFNLLQSVESLLPQQDPDKHTRTSVYSLIFASFKTICSTSSSDSPHYLLANSSDPTLTRRLVELQQTALMNTLTLKNVDNCVIMKVVALFFQYCRMEVFEPLNVYEKCKVFMCSMRCSDSGRELLTMIQCLDEILSNKETKKELRIVLLKEHLSYLLKLTSSTASIVDGLPTTEATQSGFSSSNGHFLTKTSEEGVQLIKSLLELLESMVDLMREDTKEQETLTVYVHILASYLSDSSSGSCEGGSQMTKKYMCDLNDLVLKKLISLGSRHKEDFKQVLNRWPEVKTKIENAFKLSTNAGGLSGGSGAVQSGTAGQVSSTQSGQSKAPKIQLKTFGNFK